MKNKTIKTRIKDLGLRIDKVLSERTSFSRSQIQKMIKSKQILLNNKPTVSSHKLEKNEMIAIQSETPKQKAKTKSKIKLDKKIKLEVIFENDDFLVINKPAGIAVHPHESSTQKTFIDYVLEKYPKIKKIGDDPQRPGIVHRLDKDVSGLMIIAKNQDSFDYLKKQFQQRLVKKTYTALVFGNIVKDHSVINFSIKRSKQGKMTAVPVSQDDPKAKTAITEYDVIKRFVNYTLVLAKPKTGRMHQIRVHFFAMNHPIVGDTLYVQRRYGFKLKPIKLDRIFLHATDLEFTGPDGKVYEFHSELPRKLVLILNKLT